MIQLRSADRDGFLDLLEQMLMVHDVALLTGFDARPCTYLYIDQSMQDHGLFQAIFRTNRLDGDDKDFEDIEPKAGVIKTETYKEIAKKGVPEHYSRREDVGAVHERAGEHEATDRSEQAGDRLMRGVVHDGEILDRTATSDSM